MEANVTRKQTAEQQHSTKVQTKKKIDLAGKSEEC